MLLFRKRSPSLFWRPGLSALIALQGVFIVYIAGYYLLAAPDAVIPNMFNVSPLLLPLEGALQAIVAPAHPAPLWQLLTIDAAGLCGMLLLFGLFAWYRVTRFRMLDEPAPQVVANQERKREQG